MSFRPRAWMILVVATASVATALAQPPDQPAPSPNGAEQRAEASATEEQGAVPNAEDDPIALPRLDAEPFPAGSDQSDQPAGAPEAREPEAREKIEQALRGEQVSPSGGDPVLEDVLKIIRDRGSILEGTELDAGARTRPESSRRAAQDASSAAQGSHIRRQARVAEMLLKTSRLLERLAPVDPQRRELISAMRAEAARVLSR